MFKFDPARFQKQLDKHQLVHMDNLSPGMFRIFDIVFNNTLTKHIDFNSFTREEMERVLEDANGYQCNDDYGQDNYDDEDEDDGEREYSDANWGNAVYEYLRCIEIQDTLHHTKNKIFDEEDDFL